MHKIKKYRAEVNEVDELKYSKALMDEQLYSHAFLYMYLSNYF